jgi:hypothetical protein
LGRHFWPRSDRRPTRPWPIDAAEARFIGEHDAQTATTPGGGPPGFPHSIRKVGFLKAFCAGMSPSHTNKGGARYRQAVLRNKPLWPL